MSKSHPIFFASLLLMQVVVQSATAEEPPTASLPVEVKDVAGVNHVFRISPQLYSGGTPSEAAGFESLAKLGVKTVVSVDGAKPALGIARQHGLRYVHIPIGYDGVPSDACKSLTTVMRKLPKPVYIHCHHGKHRGPAAAAIAAMAAGVHNQKTALQILRVAGTGSSYTGLWRDIKYFKPLPNTTPASELKSYVPPQALAKVMVAINQRFEAIAAMQKPAWLADAAGRRAAANLALLLAEDFRELDRIGAAKHDEGFQKQLDAAVESSLSLKQHLQENKPIAAGQALDTLRKNCIQCHAGYRN